MMNNDEPRVHYAMGLRTVTHDRDLHGERVTRVWDKDLNYLGTREEVFGR